MIPLTESTTYLQLASDFIVTTFRFSLHSSLPTVRSVLQIHVHTTQASWKCFSFILTSRCPCTTELEYPWPVSAKVPLTSSPMHCLFRTPADQYVSLTHFSATSRSRCVCSICVCSLCVCSMTFPFLVGTTPHRFSSLPHSRRVVLDQIKVCYCSVNAYTVLYVH